MEKESRRNIYDIHSSEKLNANRRQRRHELSELLPLTVELNGYEAKACYIEPADVPEKDAISAEQLLFEKLIQEIDVLQQRYELSKTVGSDYFEPGKMEYLDQSFGSYDEKSGRMILRFEAKGTRYEGRTENIESMKAGDVVHIIRDEKNPYNEHNFTLQDARGRNIGNMPAELCNAIAPLFDMGSLYFERSVASFVEPISKRSRYAKQAMLFVELEMSIAHVYQNS